MILGCAMPEAEQGLNVARIASLRAGVPVDASAVTINRFCSSGLQSIAFAAERIMCGFADAVIAGGTESMSMVPMGGNKISPNPALVDSYPDVYLSTGLVAENHARESGITREEQDAFALRSHQRALAAIDVGPVRRGDHAADVSRRNPGARSGGLGRVNGRPQIREVTFTQDEGPRRDTSAEALAKLRPAFHATGTRHRRQLVADERRRGRGARHVGRRSRRSAGWSRSAASSRSPPRASSRSASASARCRRFARC